MPRMMNRLYRFSFFSWHRAALLWILKWKVFWRKWLYFLLFSQITIYRTDICIILKYPTVAPQIQPTRFTSPAVVWRGSACVCLISHGRSYGSHGADGHRSSEPTAKTSALESGKKRKKKSNPPTCRICRVLFQLFWNAGVNVHNKSRWCHLRRTSVTLTQLPWA